MSSFHKKTKFPFEITKGKAKDLYKLRFIRKSELEPQVRHHFRYSSEQMDRRLNLWYKEQQTTLGTLSRSQEKLYQSRRRLHKEQKRIQKIEYARQQEEIRSKLKNIRLRMIALKVLGKFRENVRVRQEDRREEMMRRALAVAEAEFSLPDVPQPAPSVGPSVPSLPMRVMSSSGRRMETIPEERGDEADDPSIQPNPRSPFQKGVHRSKDGTVTIGTQTDRYTDSSTRSRDDTTSNSSSATTSKKIVVTIPKEQISPPRSPTGSNKGTAGSGSNISEDSSESRNSPSSNHSFGSDISLSIPDETNYTDDELSLPLQKYKEAISRKDSGNSVGLPAVKYNIPDEEISSHLPNNKTNSLELKKKNPFTLQYRERSFILQSKLSFPELEIPDAKGPHFCRSASLHELDFPDELRKKRHEERMATVRQEMTKDQTMQNLEEEYSHMTVYGVRADHGRLSNTPPNTPMVLPKASPKRPARSQLSVVLLNQKRAQNTDKKKTGHTAIQDTAQTYERTKDGKFVPLGMHRQKSFELPSMKEKHEREKLLKQERITMFSQQAKMKHFIDKFATESDRKVRAPATKNLNLLNSPYFNGLHLEAVVDHPSPLRRSAISSFKTPTRRVFLHRK